MKQKKQTEKKLSLKKLQMVGISNPKAIKGGGGTQNSLNLTEDSNNTGTVGTSRKD